MLPGLDDFIDKLQYYTEYIWLSEYASVQNFYTMCIFYGIRENEEMNVEKWESLWDGFDPAIPFFYTITNREHYYER